jgi:hypothetical protein
MVPQTLPLMVIRKASTTTKIFIGGVLVLGVILFLSSRQVKTNTGHEFKIETIGLDGLGILLESPYGKESPYHALIINNSSHHIIACELVYEQFINDGRSFSSRRVIAFGDLLRAPQTTRNALLESSPGIAPHSKMLVGLGVEPGLAVVVEKLPHVENTSEIIFNQSIKIEKLVITLTAVVLENGEAEGPKAQDFATHLKESVLKEPQ